MTDTEMILQAIGELKADVNRRFEAMDTKIDNLKADMNSRFEVVDEKIDTLDTSIGMLAEWADDVAVVVKVPFAKGKAIIQ